MEQKASHESWSSVLLPLALTLGLALLLAHIKPAVEIARRTHPELKGSDLVPEAVRVNVFQSIEELFKRSEIIRHNVRAGKLRVVGAIYDINSGRVNQLGIHPRQKLFLYH